MVGSRSGWSHTDTAVSSLLILSLDVKKYCGRLRGIWKYTFPGSCLSIVGQCSFFSLAADVTRQRRNVEGIS
jgi:hypothetical protein